MWAIYFNKSSHGAFDIESIIISIDWKNFIGSDLEFTVSILYVPEGLNLRNSHCYHFQWKLSKASMSFCFLSLCLLKLLNMIEQILFFNLSCALPINSDLTLIILFFIKSSGLILEINFCLYVSLFHRHTHHTQTMRQI